ncbi:MAG: glycoside hydrolase family 3 protein, partial [Proteobacteria bacterium]|nr:glycoside hydrolase family 3 protein [Pseudomonadota bacterium]
MSVLALMLSASQQVMAQQGVDPAVRAEQEADALATTLVGKMTIDEKLYQLLNTAPAIPRLGVPAYNWWTESLHGALGPVPTTNFPEPVG